MKCLPRKISAKLLRSCVYTCVHFNACAQSVASPELACDSSLSNRRCLCFCDLSKPSQRLQRLIHRVAESSSHEGSCVGDVPSKHGKAQGVQISAKQPLQNEEMAELQLLVSLLPPHLRETLLSRHDISQVKLLVSDPHYSLKLHISSVWPLHSIVFKHIIKLCPIKIYNPEMQLTEVVLDLGRLPYARLPQGDVRLSESPVTQSHLEAAVALVRHSIPKCAHIAWSITFVFQKKFPELSSN